jgi:hypothetical protein
MDRFDRKGINSRRLRVESLESRALLAGHSAGASFGLATAAMHHELPDAVAAHVAAPTAGANLAAANATNAAQQTVLVAHLAQTDGVGAGSGEATFHTSTVRGVTTSRLTVELQGATANTQFTVAVNGTTLGTITTDANGAGELMLTSNPKGSQQGFPAGFTGISAGDTLTVTSGTDSTDALSGAFAAVGKPQTPPTHAQPVNLKATLTDSTAGSTATGVAGYHTVTAHGTTHTQLEVAITGATPNTTLDVNLVNSSGTTKLGTIMTDANGSGVLHVSDSSLTIAAGDTITVGTLSGTFAKVGKK